MLIVESLNPKNRRCSSSHVYEVVWILPRAVHVVLQEIRCWMYNEDNICRNKRIDKVQPKFMNYDITKGYYDKCILERKFGQLHAANNILDFSEKSIENYRFF